MIAAALQLVPVQVFFHLMVQAGEGGSRDLLSAVVLLREPMRQGEHDGWVPERVHL